MIHAKMQAYQPMFTANTREKEFDNENTIDDAMYACLKEDENARHKMILFETESYYKALTKEI